MSDSKKPPMSPRAKKYWASLIGASILGVIGGFLTYPVGYELGRKAGAGEMPAGSWFEAPIDSTVAVAIAVIWGVLLPIMCILYHRNVDEQEENAFLWAGLIGWYAMIIIAPVWWVLAWAGIWPEAHIMGIFLVGMIVNSAVFLWKKFH